LQLQFAAPAAARAAQTNGRLVPDRTGRPFPLLIGSAVSSCVGGHPDLPAGGHEEDPMAITERDVRHEALVVRMQVKDRPSSRRRSGGMKLEAA
jgi:hypothetical protein